MKFKWGFVYIFKINNKEYIGCTINLKKRFKEHFRIKKYNQYFHNSLRKYFPLNRQTSFRILEVYKQKETEKKFTKLILNKEKFWIKEKNTYDPKQITGWNLTKGGEGTLGVFPTEETREKMRKTRNKYLQEHPEKMKGEYHPFWGKTHCEKTKKLQSKKRKKYLNEHPKTREELKGETNPNAKLTKENVIEIKRLINENKLPRKDIFTFFKISKKQFYRIKNNESWKGLI